MSEATKNYELRDIEADDLDYLTSIIDKIGIDKVADCIDKNALARLTSGNDDTEGENTEDKGKLIEAVGIKFMLNVASTIIKNYKLAKDDIYAFLASLSGLSVEEIAHLKLPEYVAMIIAVCKKDDFIDSFKAASSLLK